MIRRKPAFPSASRTGLTRWPSLGARTCSGDRSSSSSIPPRSSSPVRAGKALGQYVKSRDRRNDSAQTVLGIVLDDVVPMASEMWPGNTADVVTLHLAAVGIGTVCMAADARMISKNADRGDQSPHELQYRASAGREESASASRSNRYPLGRCRPRAIQRGGSTYPMTGQPTTNTGRRLRHHSPPNQRLQSGGVANVDFLTSISNAQNLSVTARTDSTNQSSASGETTTAWIRTSRSTGQ